LALVAVFAVGEEQDGLVEMREAPLNVDHADNASIIFGVWRSRHPCRR
jgi:hypothetical protein